MPNVFTKSKIMNHFLCDSCAAFHKATPFQDIDHMIIITTSQTGKLSNGAVI